MGRSWSVGHGSFIANGPYHDTTCGRRSLRLKISSADMDAIALHTDRCIGTCRRIGIECFSLALSVLAAQAALGDPGYPGQARNIRRPSAGPLMSRRRPRGSCTPARVPAPPEDPVVSHPATVRGKGPLTPPSMGLRNPHGASGQARNLAGNFGLDPIHAGCRNRSRTRLLIQCGIRTVPHCMSHCLPQARASPRAWHGIPQVFPDAVHYMLDHATVPRRDPVAQRETPEPVRHCPI